MNGDKSGSDYISQNSIKRTICLKRMFRVTLSPKQR